MTKANIVTYPAVFHDNEAGGYIVTFPDIEEAMTSGQTLGESLVNATTVLGQTLHHHPMVLPTATTITELMHQYPHGIHSVCRGRFRPSHCTRSTN